MATDDSLLIHEIYASIQGESTFAGLRCAFVRTSTCNLRCRWCDTPQAFTGGVRRPRAEVFEETLALGTPLVLLTGGEPLLQPAVPRLARELLDAGKTVLIETSGERDISTLDPRVHRIVDFKPPGSGEVERNRWENVEHLSERDEVKFVLCDRTDYDWARDMLTRHELASRVTAVLMSPVWGELDPKDLAAWILEDALPVRMQIQAHKVIWGSEAEGV